MHPVPVFNPATDGPLPSDFFDSELGALVAAFLMAVPLVGLLAALAASGIGYLHAAPLTGRCRTGWVCAVIAAALVDVAFIAVFLDPVPLFGQIVLGQANWGLLGFSAAFVVVGAAMVAVITAAAREARRQADRIRNNVR